MLNNKPEGQLWSNPLSAAGRGCLEERHVGLTNHIGREKIIGVYGRPIGPGHIRGKRYVLNYISTRLDIDQ